MSKGKHFSEAQCPFYRSDAAREILCEGVPPGSVMKTIFPTAQRALRHFRKYCARDYERCPLCRLLEALYAEKEKDEDESKDSNKYAAAGS